MKAVAVACLTATLAACPGRASRRQEPVTTAHGEEAPMIAAVSPAGDKHPGEIVYEDRVENRTWTRLATDVPVTMAWVKVDETWKPVVRIEIVGDGDQREITKFGPAGEFLETTVAHLSAPTANPAPVPTPVPTPTE